MSESVEESVLLQLQRRYRYYLDKTVLYPTYRWIALAALVTFYWLRVYTYGGFYIVTYGLGIYMLNLLIGFLSPQIDPESEGPVLPMKNNEEYRPFARKLSEFHFWYSTIRAVLIALTMTMFSFFDIPVFWPVLLLYFIILFSVTMRNQISQMIKYRYVPFSWGKKRYDSKKEASSNKAEPIFKGTSNGIPPSRTAFM